MPSGWVVGYATSTMWQEVERPAQTLAGASLAHIPFEQRVRRLRGARSSHCDKTILQMRSLAGTPRCPATKRDWIDETACYGSRQIERNPAKVSARVCGRMLIDTRNRQYLWTGGGDDVTQMLRPDEVADRPAPPHKGRRRQVFGALRRDSGKLITTH